MPRTTSVLSVAALAGATLGFAGAAYADSAAGVGPSTVSPGGSVTVSVACGSTGGPPPATVDATCAAAPGGQGKAWSAPFHVSGDGGDGGGRGDSGGGGGHGDVGVGSDGGRGGDVGGGYTDGGGGDVGVGDIGGGDSGGGGGHGEGRPCTEPAPDSCGGAGTQDGTQNGTQHGMEHGVDHGVEPGVQNGIQHGVEAGAGGSFTDSVPALVAGGILIAGAVGAATYRLCLRGSVRYR
ncbi:hypothetical protein GCM10022403_097400 [Streptomyces coacervatus]|uniref:Secreted protein n=1 Tax=Streptomyces coacervatus TaxID=647381 RepID=A0ABP7JRE8_9ACTN|nr:hypothetical protein [Streptomyces coacervatus]MDF2264008.1 hypothetical protein [Streptomyces coacervatus]